MENFVTFIHVVVALFMILVVLIQGGNQGGVGAAFGGGGGAGSAMSAAGSQSLLGKLTYGAAAIFMATSVTLTYMGADTSSGVGDKLQERAQEGAAAEMSTTEETKKEGESEESP